MPKEITANTTASNMEESYFLLAFPVGREFGWRCAVSPPGGSVNNLTIRLSGS
jgi:hypothetical protein